MRLFNAVSASVVLGLLSAACAITHTHEGRFSDHSAPEGSLDPLQVYEVKAAPHDFVLETQVAVPTTLYGQNQQAYADAVISPDGNWLAFVYLRNGVRNVAVIASPSQLKTPTEKPTKEPFRKVTEWSFDSFAPSWSPDGKRLAFFTTYNPGAKNDSLSIAVVDADERNLRGVTVADRVVAIDAVADAGRGPQWSPKGDWLIYAQKGDDALTPIALTHVESRQTYRLQLPTTQHRNIHCSPEGILAFEAQVGDTWRIYQASTNLSQPAALRLTQH